MSEITTFFVYPDTDHKRKHRVKVFVTPTRAKMHRLMREMGAGPVSKNGMAYCASAEGEEDGTRTSTFAVMYFNRADLNSIEDHSMDTITHECVHAAHRYSELVDDDEVEEVIAYACGSMVGQVHAELTSKKIRH